jgi:putative Mg2+ transporter-C (MgtC) family protein
VEVLDVFARLGIAAVLTAVIGLDRELRAKAAGLRTNIVVGTATAAFALLGAEVINGDFADPGRVAAQVVSGIGFLGGGAIFAAGGKPSGLTTAAALWGSAAVGLAAGVAAYDVAIALVVVLFLALWPLDLLTHRMLQSRGRHDVQIQLVLSSLDVLDRIRELLVADDVRVIEMELTELGGQPMVELRLSGAQREVARVLSEFGSLEGVTAVASGAVARLHE